MNRPYSAITMITVGTRRKIQGRRQIKNSHYKN